MIVVYYILSNKFWFSQDQAWGITLLTWIIFWTWIYFYDKANRYAKKFVPHYFNIRLNVLEILKEAWINEQWIKGLWFDSVSNETVYEQDDINYYFFNKISYSVLNVYETWYLMHNHNEQWYCTKVLKRIALKSPKEKNQKKDKTHKHSSEYSYLYLREWDIWYEIWLLKWDIKNWWEWRDEEFDDKDNYKILGILPFSLIHNDIEAKKTEWEILKKYGLEYDSYFNEYWRYSEYSLNSKYINVDYWTI